MPQRARNVPATLTGGKPRGRANVLTLVEYAAEELRERILSGELAAGERILLDEVADDLGISPIPLREALRSLASEGLVAPLPRRGYTISPATVADLDDTYRVRLELEPLAVTLAVPALTQSHLAHLRSGLEQLDAAIKASDWPSHRVHHRAFHFGIYEKSNSPWLIRFTDMLWANSERYQQMTTQIRGELSDRMVEHQAVLEACERGDATGAGELMRTHLQQAFTTLHGFLAEREAKASGLVGAT